MFSRNIELISKYAIWKCILCWLTRKLDCNFQVSACFHPSVLLVKPLRAVVVPRGISGRCERVRAGNISPSFWGCQGLDKSCLNFTLCKMPCVNSCPWPKRSDPVRQTPEAHPSPRQWARVQFWNFQELTNKLRFQRGSNRGSSRKESSVGSPDRIFSVLLLAVFCHV